MNTNNVLFGSHNVCDSSSSKVVRRSIEGRGKPLDAGNTEPVVLEDLEGNLCPSVDVFFLDEFMRKQISC